MVMYIHIIFICGFEFEIAALPIQIDVVICSDSSSNI